MSTKELRSGMNSLDLPVGITIDVSKLPVFIIF